MVHWNDSVNLRALVRVRRWIDVVRWGWGDILQEGVFVLLLCTSEVSRQRGEGYNGIRMGLVEMGKELVDTIGLALPHHQSLHTIRTLTRHRKLRTENYDVKISCDSIIQSLFRQWWKRPHIWQSTLTSILTHIHTHSYPYSLISPSANPRRHDMSQIVSIRLCISSSTPEHVMFRSSTCKNLVQPAMIRSLRC